MSSSKTSKPYQNSVSAIKDTYRNLQHTFSGVQKEVKDNGGSIPSSFKRKLNDSVSDLHDALVCSFEDFGQSFSKHLLRRLPRRSSQNLLKIRRHFLSSMMPSSCSKMCSRSVQVSLLCTKWTSTRSCWTIANKSW